MATPRDLDPKFRKENPEAAKALDDPETPPPGTGGPGGNGTPPNTPPPGDEKPPTHHQGKQEHESHIVYIERGNLPDGTPTEKKHGPIPVSEWAAYEKEHNL